VRGLDEEKTAQTIIDGFRIYYNFIRPYMGLEGETPAKEANIDLELGRNHERKATTTIQTLSPVLCLYYLDS